MDRGESELAEESGEDAPEAREFESSGALFIHDFVGVDAALETVISSLRSVVTPALLGDLVCSAWKAESEVLDEVLAPTTDHVEPSVAVEMGRPRTRRDAVVVPIAWRPISREWVPPLEADLEIAAFGPRRTHLHLLGRSRLPPGQVPLSMEASLSHRFTVAVVRHVLTLLVGQIDPGREDRSHFAASS